MQRNKMLVIIDMLNGFLVNGNLANTSCRRIIPKIESMTEYAVKNDWEIVAFCDQHEKSDAELNIFPEHCMKGTWESEIIDELRRFEPYFTVIPKNTTDGFFTREFMQKVIEKDYEEAVITGVLTDFCVKDFALSYQKFTEQNRTGTQVKVATDAIDTFDGYRHNLEFCTTKTLIELDKAGVKLVQNACSESKEKDLPQTMM